MSLNAHTFTSAPITLKFNNDIIGYATGFFYRFNDKIYLVSNWHVLSGRNPHNSQPLDSNGCIPDKIDIIVHKSIFSNYLPIRYDKSENHSISLEKTKFLQHPLFGQDVDVAIIEFKKGSKLAYGSDILCINDIQQNKNIDNSVGDDVFILGFPIKSQRTNNFCIWKRGSIATEYSINYRNKESFLVDSITKSGMSGSPVIFMANNFRTLNGSMSISTSPVTKFLGVYSGREPSADGSVPQLGLVWKAKYIEEILIGKTYGSSKEFGSC